MPAVLDSNAAGEALQTKGEADDHHPDLYYLTPAPEKRATSIEQVRDAISALALTSHEGIAKVLIVDPAESLTLAAANALLKTLEEPTPNTYFFLVSHQPGILPATVRSRCQVLSLLPPPTEVALDWLVAGTSNADAQSRAVLLRLASGAPLRALALYGAEYININSELEDIFQQISILKIDPQGVADRWLKGDVEVYLAWLATRLEWAIKGRLAPDAWTSVTDLGPDSLHNTWRSLTLTTLFERLQGTQTLLGQLGRGVNVDLALRVLLLGFQPERGKT
jgi:DNA polymerase-3 subunit delta'